MNVLQKEHDLTSWHTWNAAAFLAAALPTAAYLPFHPTPAQYLFNVPEGFARFALEHKVRPGLALRAAFVSSIVPSAAGGLAGLLLRLKADGHGQLALVGPLGVLTCRLRHGVVSLKAACDVRLPDRRCIAQRRSTRSTRSTSAPAMLPVRD